MLKWKLALPIRITSISVLTLLVALLATAAVACGGDDDEVATAPPAAVPTAPAVATQVPATEPPPEKGGGKLIVANDLIGPRAFRPSVLTGGAHSAFGLQDWGFYDFLIRADYSAPPSFGTAGSGGLAGLSGFFVRVGGRASQTTGHRRAIHDRSCRSSTCDNPAPRSAG